MSHKNPSTRAIGTTELKIPLNNVELINAPISSSENFGDIKAVNVSMMAYDTSMFLCISFFNNNVISKYTIDSVKVFDNSGKIIPSKINKYLGIGRDPEPKSSLHYEESRFKNLLLISGNFENGISKVILRTFNTDKMIINLANDKTRNFIANANLLISNSIGKL
ncbi:hypothetical protein [Rhizosphaericola mali]|uniref:Uncharacterized protein n=1 Tax=Rhizosphaericola mali TaxID=2545455 RepID=A0A5P2G663_9BACT|nr:hypothetical protein [Rhizosphaericola mali]QES90158.1 hypothetical protein E0W69_016385 [Rhizosphaericola mali]